MAMCTLFYYVIPLKVLWRILTAFSTQWNSLSCHFCLVICCKQPMPFTFPVSVLAQFFHLLWFLALSKENTELTANIRHLNLSTSPHIISNQCHAAKNNFAIAMHVETNPYLWCIKEKVKTCNYTESYTALREKALWGEPGSMSGYFKTILFSKFLWKLFHA